MNRLKSFESGEMTVWYKVISGSPHPSFAKTGSRKIDLGIAFRSHDSPIGYYPFFGENDFNFSGETEIKEHILARLPIDLSSIASPHTLLIKATAEDIEFLGSGAGGNLIDIQKEVRLDLTKHAMRAASGVMVDGIMAALGGPVIKSVVSQFAKSAVKRFVISKSIGSAVKTYLKKTSGVSPDEYLLQ